MEAKREILKSKNKVPPNLHQQFLKYCEQLVLSSLFKQLMLRLGAIKYSMTKCIISVYFGKHASSVELHQI